ncbi:MAG: GNAT family N-acetyltransferase [Candidatus Caenarcaniphilales bacterium]|nr:GNAT family N-acetyltransferase [Candidatus Caenarcaniphilales bacterium]
MLEIKHYNKSLKDEWDDFVSSAKNSSFLFLRDYMDYHSDRFQDYSLMFYEESKLLALIPANISDDIVYSHQGLTYGGLIVNHEIKTIKYKSIFEELIKYLKQSTIKKLIYKSLPHIYHSIAAEEDIYLLFTHNAELIKRNISSSIKLNNKVKFSSRRIRGIKKAEKNNLNIVKNHSLNDFYSILEKILKEKHSVRPVHSISELENLKEKFPENIHLYSCYQEQECLAGVIIYETKEVAHAQYIAASELGKELGALDLLFNQLINNDFNHKSYFDFGISSVADGKTLNEGLINQKEEFGARAIVYDAYEIPINSFPKEEPQIFLGT